MKYLKNNITWLSITIIFSACTLFFLNKHYSHKRKISLKGLDSTQAKIIVELIQLSDGKYVLVDVDSTILPIEPFDQILFDRSKSKDLNQIETNSGESASKLSDPLSDATMTIGNFIIRRSDSIFLYDIKSRKQVLKNHADSIGTLNDHLVVTKENNLYGFINITNASYDQHPRFTYFNYYTNGSEVIVGVTNNMYGFFNATNAKTIVDFNYDYISDFNSSKTAYFIAVGKKGFINSEGKIISTYDSNVNIDLISQGFLLSRDNLMGLANSIGELHLEIKYQSISSLCDNADCGLLVSYNGLKGLYNNGLIIPCEYDDISYKGPGYWIYKNGKYGVANENGTETISTQYDYISSTEGGYMVENNGKFGFVDLNGAEIISISYDKIENLSEKLFLVKNSGSYGIISKSGDVIIPCVFDKINSKDEGFITYKNGKCGFVTEAGQNLIEADYDEIEKTGKKIFVVKNDGNYGVINSTGTLTIPCEYKNLTISALDGYAKVQSYWGLYGWINYYTGETIIEPQYLTVQGDFDGLFPRVTVSKDGETFKIQKDGRRSDGIVKDGLRDLIGSFK